MKTKHKQEKENGKHHYLKAKMARSSSLYSDGQSLIN